jgi:hypothetical protein
MRPIFTGRHSFTEKAVFLPWGCLYRLAAYAISIILCAAIIILIPDVEIPCFTGFGANTLQIYLWHKPIVLVLIKLDIYSVLSASVAGKLLWLAMSVVLTYILNIKIFSYPGQWIKRYCLHGMCEQ